MSHVDDGELTAYADGAWAAEEADAQRIAAHLAECVNCRNRLIQAQALSARASEVLAVATPLQLQTPPFETLRAGAVRKRRFPAVPLTWAATVLLALGIGWFGRGALTTPMMTSAPEVRSPAMQENTPPTAANDAATQSAPAEQSAQAERADVQAEEPPRIARREVRTPTAEPLSADVAVGAAAPTAAASPPAPPPPAALEERAVATREQMGAAREGDASARAGNAAGSFISAAEAERRGLRLRIIPELEVVRVATNEDRVVVEQKLPDGVVVTVTTMAAARGEEVHKSRAPATPEQQRTAAASVQRSDARITVSGPLPEDSLRALALKVR